MNPADFLVAVLTRPDDFRIDTQQDRLVDKPSDFAVVYRDVCFLFLFFFGGWVGLVWEREREKIWKKERERY